MKLIFAVLQKLVNLVDRRDSLLDEENGDMLHEFRTFCVGRAVGTADGGGVDISSIGDPNLVDATPHPSAHIIVHLSLGDDLVDLSIPLLEESTALVTAIKNPVSTLFVMVLNMASLDSWGFDFSLGGAGGRTYFVSCAARVAFTSD